MTSAPNMAATLPVSPPLSVRAASAATASTGRARRRRRPRKRTQASTSARGYGYAHQKIAAVLLAAWQPGDLCTKCGKPMWQRWRLRSDGNVVSAIHLGHTDDRTGYEGLQHDNCNLRDGAVRGNRERAMDVKAVRPSRAW